MLVLSRGIGEEIVLLDRESGKEIARVMVVDIRGDKVRVGVAAGRHIEVHRLEVHEHIIRRRIKEDLERTVRHT